MNWHQRIFPIVSAIILTLTVAFAISSYFQLEKISEQLQKSPDINLTQLFKATLTAEGITQGIDNGDFLPQWAAEVQIENGLINKRYHQANAILATRIWSKYISTICGLIMICIGSIFIVAKLNEEVSGISGEAQSIRLSLKTSSPGVILCLLGTILIVVSLVSTPAITVQDANVYLHKTNAGTATVQQ